MFLKKAADRVSDRYQWPLIGGIGVVGQIQIIGRYVRSVCQVIATNGNLHQEGVSLNCCVRDKLLPQEYLEPG